MSGGEKLGLINDGFSLIKREGLWSAARKSLTLPRLIGQRLASKRHVLRPDLPVEARFTWIFERNYWGNSESKSGNGSSLRYTQNLRAGLPGLFEKYEIKSVFDGPCGDFNWMREIVDKSQISYHGVDIVAPMIEDLRSKFQSPRVTFSHMNLIDDPHPKSDLFFCRDLLFHLSFSDALSVLRRFLESGTPYLMTTTHVLGDRVKNKNIVTGDFRLMDLTRDPFLFPSESLETIQDFVAPDPERVMRLWTREAISGSLHEVHHKII
jgi:hypothetical protein